MSTKNAKKQWGEGGQKIFPPPSGAPWKEKKRFAHSFDELKKQNFAFGRRHWAFRTPLCPSSASCNTITGSYKNSLFTQKGITKKQFCLFTIS